MKLQRSQQHQSEPWKPGLAKMTCSGLPAAGHDSRLPPAQTGQAPARELFGFITKRRVKLFYRATATQRISASAHWNHRYNPRRLQGRAEVYLSAGFQSHILPWNPVASRNSGHSCPNRLSERQMRRRLPVCELVKTLPRLA